MAASRLAAFLSTFDSDPKRRGTQWERVCKWFLETDPVYRAQLKKVWLWKKWTPVGIARRSYSMTPAMNATTSSSMPK